MHNKVARIPPIENAESLVGKADPAIEAPALPKREAILQAGVRVFMEQGFESANMDEVARLAGVSKATIYSHFDGKQDLFGAIITGRCQAMIPVIEAAVFGDQAPAEALRTIGRQFLDRELDGIGSAREALVADRLAAGRACTAGEELGLGAEIEGIHMDNLCRWRQIL